MKKFFSIIFENEDLLILNKQPNVLVIPDRYNADKPNLYNMLEKTYSKIWVVHRLDKTTSGAIIFAKNEAIHKHLQNQFEKREVQKKYLCLVIGTPSSTGAIDHAIARHPSKKRMIVSNKGKSSLTHYKLLESYGRYSLLEVDIQTGRTHQIRVHLESIGHPLVADPLYGGSEAFFLSTIKPKFRLSKDRDERPLLSRVALHAHSIRFKGLDEEVVSADAELPKDLKATIQQLRKLSK